MTCSALYQKQQASTSRLQEGGGSARYDAAIRALVDSALLRSFSSVGFVLD